MDKEKEDLRKVALEFVISLSEAQLAMVQKSQWVDGCDHERVFGGDRRAP